MKRKIRNSLIIFLLCVVLYAAARILKGVVTLPEDVFNFVHNLQRFFFMLAAVLLVVTVLIAIIDRFSVKSKRGKTLCTVLVSILRYAQVIVIAVWGLTIFGVNTAAIFASLGIVSLVLGFGAQSLIEDIITGIFILFEGHYNVEDVIEIDGFRGTVQKMGVRTTALADLGGNVKIVNNSDIRNVLNRSVQVSTAICDISIAYDESIENAERVLEKVFPKIKEKYGEYIVEGPIYMGVQELADSAVVLRIIAKVNEVNVFTVQRALNRELKLAFDENGINIPFPQMVVHQAKELQVSKLSEDELRKVAEFLAQQTELKKRLDIHQ